MGEASKHFSAFFPRPRQNYLPHPLTATYGFGEACSGRVAAYSTDHERGMTMPS